VLEEDIADNPKDEQAEDQEQDGEQANGDNADEQADEQADERDEVEDHEAYEESANEDNEEHIELYDPNDVREIQVNMKNKATSLKKMILESIGLYKRANIILLKSVK